MRRSNSFSWLLTALALSALALGLLSLPEDLSQPIRKLTRDLGRPGQTLTRICFNWGYWGWQGVRSWQARREEVERLEAQLDLASTRNREYQAALTVLRQRLNQAEEQSTTAPAERTDPLFIAELIEARVLGQETVALASGRRLLGVGKSQGIGEDLLVVESGRATIDVGADLGLSIHQPVFSGEIVIGRTATCGSYSSSLQSVTDAKFQGPAQLLRKIDSGFQPGPEGIIEGTGKGLCRLTGIWWGESVEVGNEVYTPASDPLLPHPMFYGRIVRAELKEGMPHWEIDVEPAAKNLRPTFVKVVRPTENRSRITAN